MGEIYAAKTNHITNPVGYALKPLVFSWKVKGCKGQEQRHARIMISKEPTFTTLCFDTGEAALDSRAARVEFDPQPCTRYYWKVLVATDAAETIESDVQFFETAKRRSHGQPSGSPVTAASNVIRFFPSGSARPGQLHAQGCIFAVWDCTKHIFWGKPAKYRAKSATSI